MKKISALLSLLFLLTLAGRAQNYTLTLNTVLTDSNSNPVPGVWIYLTVWPDSICGFSAYDSCQTNASGQCTISISVPPCVTNGYFTASSNPCNTFGGQQFSSQFGPNPMLGSTFTWTFISCPAQGGGGGGGSTTFNIQGFVGDSLAPSFIVNGFDSADVYLIQYDSAQGTLLAIDTTMSDSGGFFQFLNIPNGSYLVKAALRPSAPLYSSRMPTYHTSSLLWSSADYVNQTNANSFVFIDMITGVNPGGPGFIGGLVSQGANKRMSPGDPLEGIDVLLLDINDNPITWTRSNSLGEFSFPGLAYGTYKIWPEVAGKTTTPVIVTISPSSPSATNISIHVNSTDILAGLSTQTRNIEGLEVSFYPNPVKDAGILMIDATENTVVTMIISDLNGRILNAQSLNLTEGRNRVEATFVNHPAGLYFISIETAAGKIVRKIMHD